MKVSITVGPRDEKMIELVKSTVATCQNEKTSIKMMSGKGEIIDVPHELGSCRDCSNCNKFDCAIMNLGHEYGFDKLYDAVFYAYGGNASVLEENESFIWETMTEEEYSMYLGWLSSNKLM